MAQRNRNASQTTSTNANQVHPEYASCENTDGVAFSRGTMTVNGATQLPVLAEHWESSNGLTQYTAVTWQDPATGEKRTSCNCPGWTIKKQGQPRRCKHTDHMMGISVCYDRRVGSVEIKTLEQAVANVPKCDGENLRSIMLD